ncbi:MAG: NUDIX hydrolase [bacterium]|nr:NUDIX hydrolase [bacterium]
MTKIKKWKILKREDVFKKYGRGLEKVIFKMPDGRESDYYLSKVEQPVCVLALTKDKKVILAKQFRPGPNKILLGLPGGMIDGGESAKPAMARELLEETGYRGKLKFITRCFECAYSNVHRYCFVATDCVKISEPKSEPGEYIEVVLLPLNKFRQLLRSGQMTDIEAGYLGLDCLKLI